MSHTAKKKVDDVVTRLDRITANAGRLEEEVIIDLFRRASISTTPDGFPSTAMADRTSGSKSSDDGIGRPTEELAMRNINGVRRKVDPVKQQANKIHDLIRDADYAMQDVFTALEAIHVSIEEGKQREATSSCLTCPLPANKAGFCHNCYHDWYRHGKPDRAIWVAFKTQAHNHEKPPMVLVTECPPPTPGNRAVRGPWKNITV